MECSLISTGSGEAWSCQITLRLDFDSHGQPRAPPRTISFGPLITNRTDVEIWLRRAQAAILSPHREAAEFHALNREDLRNLSTVDPQTLKFSRNSVVVDISDPDVTDLLFVDLPGTHIEERQT